MIIPVWDSQVALDMVSREGLPEEVTFEPKARELVRAKTWKSDQAEGPAGVRA